MVGVGLPASGLRIATSLEKPPGHAREKDLKQRCEAGKLPDFYRCISF